MQFNYCLMIILSTIVIVLINFHFSIIIHLPTQSPKNEYILFFCSKEIKLIISVLYSVLLVAYWPSPQVSLHGFTASFADAILAWQVQFKEGCSGCEGEREKTTDSVVVCSIRYYPTGNQSSWPYGSYPIKFRSLSRRALLEKWDRV